MSETRGKQFETKKGTLSPFAPSKTSKSLKRQEEEPHGPSGSHWGLQHLNWLHIHFALDFDWKELFSSENELSESSEITIYLKQRLNADWSWICDTEHNSPSIYAMFQELIHQRRDDDEWKTAPPSSTDPNSPSPSKGQSLRSSTSPQRNRQSTMSYQEREKTPTSPHTVLKTQPFTPGPIGRKRPLESTPSPQAPSENTNTPNRRGETTPTFQKEPEGSKASSQTTPKSQMTRDDEGHMMANGPAVMKVAQDILFRRLVEEEEEEEKAAQDFILHPLVREEEEHGPSEAASENKSENEIELVGSTFLGLVRSAIKATENNENVDKKMLDAQNLMFFLEDSSKFDIRVDDVNMTAKPDRSLFCTFGGPGHQRTVEVVLEFKKRNHMRPPSRILGQELAELLGAVLKEKLFLDKVAKRSNRAAEGDKIYTSYLISWHGLMAYVSRFDATHEYLEQLKLDSKRLQNMDPPRIRRSRLLNLTKTQDRIDLAIIAARIAIEQLSRYDRNWISGLIPRLGARREQREREASSSLESSVGGEKPVNRELLRHKLCADCRLVLDSD